MRRSLLLVLVILLMLALTPTVAQAAPSFDQAIDKLVADGYPQYLEDHFTSLGSSAIGFRFAGSSSDDQAAWFIACQLRKAGLKNVRLEPVPIDVQEFKGAWVLASGKKLTASTFGGVRGTPWHGLKGQLVYVGAGTPADLDAAGDVRGKLVLMDAYLGSWWMNVPWTEATLRGARGIIYTSTPADESYYAEPASLGSFDAEYNDRFAPVVYISMNDGAWLKQEMTAAAAASKSFCVTMINRNPIRHAEDGGVGYNVVAELPGKVHNGQMVVVSAHHDAYFRAGLDDTGGTVAGLTIAKAMRMSCYRPDRTIVFLFTTGEEYGRVNSYYDWCIGAWWAITHAHKDWPGRVAGQINLESMAMNSAVLQTRATPELRGLIDATAAADPSLVPYTYTIQNVNSWNDQWTFTAAGVPSIYLRARTADYGYKWYHTDFDTKALMDYEYLGKIAKFAYRLETSLDTLLLPYDLQARAADLSGTIDATELETAGADTAVIDRVTADAAAFNDAVAAWKTRGVPVGKEAAVSRALLCIEKTINKSFTALDVGDNTIYPHQQVLWDTQALNTAIAALKAPDATAALTALKGVGTTYLGLAFSHDNFKIQLSMHAPGFKGLYWGAQGKLAPYLDVIKQYRAIEAGDLTTPLASLTAMRDGEVQLLNQRLEGIACVLERVTAQVNALP